jgi:hypothetical protein
MANKDILKEQISAGIPGNTKLRKNQKLYLTMGRILYAFDYLLSVVAAIGQPDFGAGGGYPYKSMLHRLLHFTLY